jgi:hypothetical protein
VTLLEFFQAAARASVIASDIFQWVTHGLFVAVAAAGAMHVTVVVAVLVAVIMVVLAIWAVNVGFLLHEAYSGM